MLNGPPAGAQMTFWVCPNNPDMPLKEILDVARSVPRRDVSDVDGRRLVARPLRLEGRHLSLVAQRQTDVVQSLQ